MTTLVNPDISILIVDDDVAVAQAFVAYLKASFGAVRSVTTLKALPAALREYAPDVVVLDLKFGKYSSLRMLPKLCRDYPAVRFVMFTVHDEPSFVETALRAGALGYASKTADASELCFAISEAVAGRTFVSGEVYAHHRKGATKGAQRAPPSDLRPTARQMEVVEILRYGYSIADAAKRLDIAVATVDKHLRNLRDATGIKNRALLITWAEQFMARPIARGK